MPEVNIIVQNADGSPLMPTHHYGRVKRMLKVGKARIVSLKPFAIRLTYQIVNPGLDTVTLGIDPGRTNIGLSLIDSKGRNLGSYLVETDNRDIPHNVSNKKKHRQASRWGERKRRQRRAVAHDNTLKITELYRILPGCKKAIKCKGIKNSESRFNNRKRSEGWLTPTAKHLLNTHLRIVEIMSRYYPIANVAIEINRFDFAKMENPGIRNWEYQKGRLFGFKNRNDAVFHDQDGKCLLCGKRPIEHYHHIVPRGRGSESMDNIAGLCKQCHDLVHKDIHAQEQLKAKKQGLLKKHHAVSVINQIMPSLLKELSSRYPTYTTTGWQTQKMRAFYGYPQKEPDDGTHYIDAWLIAVDAMGITPAEIPAFEHVGTIMQFRRHDRARIHYQHERAYYLGKTKVCTNRHKRTGQTKTISLAEYRVLHPHEVSKLTVKKSTRGYNNMKRIMPGALVRWHGKILTVSGMHNTRYRFVETNICKEAPASECTIIRHNNGWAFI